MAADVRYAVAQALFDRLYEEANLPSASGYMLSQSSAERQGIARVTDAADLTYGDVPFSCMTQVLCAAIDGTPGGVFVDLGSGIGRGVLAAALLHNFSRCVGVELLQELHEAALEPARRFAELRAAILAAESGAMPNFNLVAGAVELHCGDLFDHPLADATLVFVCCVTWGPAIMQRLAAKLATELPEGARIVTVGQRLPEMFDLGEKRGAVLFEEAARIVEACEWGRESFVVHRTLRVGELLARRYRKGKQTR